MPIHGSRTSLLVLAAAVLTLGSCSDAGPIGAGSSPGVTEETTTPSSAPAKQLNDQYDVRYCEVLTVTIAERNATAEVWGTQGLNDCPQEAFASIEPAAVAADLGATVALRNGPRYWVLDSIVANELAGSGKIRTFGGIEMRSIALVDLGSGLPDRRPYVEVSVARDTEFVFDAGREIHELTAPDGSAYVMQSYSAQVDPTLTAADLTTLGDRLDLPDGWQLTSRVLSEPLVVEDIDGTAVVIQDELQNSYQLRARR